MAPREGCDGQRARPRRLWPRCSVGYLRSKEGWAGGDSLLDRFMPDYDVCERHQIAIVAPVEVTFEAAKQIGLEGSPLVHAIFKARALITGGEFAGPRERPRRARPTRPAM